MAKKSFLKNTQGICDILHLLNLIDDHNPHFYENSIHYMTREHLPFDNSWIYYHPTENSFKFIGRASKKIGAILTDIPSTTWKNYNQYSPYWIKEDTFGYLSIEPHIVIVSNAAWILQSNDAKRLAGAFYMYMKDHVAKEREIWKSMMEPDEIKNKQLF